MTNEQNTPPEPPQGYQNDSKSHPEGPQPGMSPNLQPNMQDMQELKKAQNLVMIANIAGPVSVFLGGVLLSTVGVVCVAVARGRLTRLMGRTTKVGAAATQLRRSSTVGLVICAIALVLNAISFFILLPEVMQAVESGDYGPIALDAGGGAVGSNTWG